MHQNNDLPRQGREGVNGCTRGGLGKTDVKSHQPPVCGFTPPLPRSALGHIFLGRRKRGWCGVITSGLSPKSDDLSSDNPPLATLRCPTAQQAGVSQRKHAYMQPRLVQRRTKFVSVYDLNNTSIMPFWNETVMDYTFTANSRAVVRIHTIKNPGSTNPGNSLCLREINPQE